MEKLKNALQVRCSQKWSKSLKSQLLNWNPLYNIHRLIILLFILFSLLRKKQKLIIYGLFISMVLQHGVLLISHPSSRYAYLALCAWFVVPRYTLIPHPCHRYVYCCLILMSYVCMHGDDDEQPAEQGPLTCMMYATHSHMYM